MKGHTLIGIIIILVGFSILFHIPIFNYLIAFVILWIGIKVLMGRGSNWESFTSAKGTLRDNFVRRVLVFSEINTKLVSEKVEGMEFVMVFGGGEVDASSAKSAKKDIDVELVAIFGGIKLRLPKAWKVESEGTGILGGFDDKTKPNKITTSVHLKGVAIFGGVEIVN